MTLVAGSVFVVAGTYETLPTHNTDQARFDTIIVLGSPADPDGKASVIMSGGAAHNGWVEGEVMARLAEAAGVPSDDVVVEGQSLNTIQNVFYSNRIMEERGWKSAEVVSSPSHLPRTGLILEHYGFAWRTHASKWPPEYGWHRLAVYYGYEALGTTVLRWFGFRRSPFMPRG